MLTIQFLGRMQTNRQKPFNSAITTTDGRHHRISGENDMDLF